MDLTKLNEAASKDKATSLKDLDPTQQYLVTDLRNVKTSYGDKIVADLDDGRFVYIPSSACRHLQKNETEYLLLQNAANKLKLVIQPLGGYKLKFEIV